MSRVFLYIVSANKNPDHLDECNVPYEIDSREIFFGPCKIRLRELFNKQNSDHNIEDTYFVGLNGNNRDKIRKIIWIGKMKEKLTFAAAYEKMNGKLRYKKMMQEEFSPLHVAPIKNGSDLLGYKLRSSLHSDNDDWVSDIVRKKNHLITDANTNSIYKREKDSVKDVFTRDVCFIFENIFFAKGQGISLNSKILNILKQSQKGVIGISEDAPFGLDKNRNINGKRGFWLEIPNKYSENFLKEILIEKTKIKGSEKLSVSKRNSGKCKC